MGDLLRAVTSYDRPGFGTLVEALHTSIRMLGWGLFCIGIGIYSSSVLCFFFFSFFLFVQVCLARGSNSIAPTAPGTNGVTRRDEGANTRKSRVGSWLSRSCLCLGCWSGAACIRCVLISHCAVYIPYYRYLIILGYSGSREYYLCRHVRGRAIHVEPGGNSSSDRTCQGWPRGPAPDVMPATSRPARNGEAGDVRRSARPCKVRLLVAVRYLLNAM